MQPEVVELRTHGVSGTPPESLLDASAVVQIDGDTQGRFFQSADTLGDPLPRVADLKCGARPVIRFREGYHWGNMTSGGLRQALWAVLLPFAMVNLAQWMIPPVNGAFGRVVVFLLRAVVRTVGLLLTMLIMVQLTVIVADVVAAQCVTSGIGGCRLGVMKWFAAHPFWLSVAVALAVIAPVVAASTITRLSRLQLREDAPEAEEPRPDGESARPRIGIAADDFYAEERTSPARTLHALAGLAASALVLTGGVRPLDGDTNRGLWSISLALLVIAVLVMFALDDPRGTGGQHSFGGHRLTQLFDRYRNGGIGLVWWAAGVAVVVAAATVTLRQQLTSATQQRLIGVDVLVATVVEVLIWLCVAAGALTAVVALVSRRQFWKGRGTGAPATVPRPYRPWLLGTATAVLLPLAVLLGAGLGTGATQAVRSCLTVGCRPQLLSAAQSDGPRMPQIYEAIALMWGLIAVGLVGGVVIGLLLLGRAKFAGAPVAERVQGDDETWSWFVARLNQHTHRIVAALLGWSVLTGLVAVAATDQPLPVLRRLAETLRLNRAADLLTGPDGLTGWGRFAQGLGVLVLGLVLAALMWAIYNAYRRPDTAGRSLGVLWDLASFWPSEGHAFVPPCYARRAVPDLTRRARWYLTRYPDTKLVLCGHSQGSLLMYATVLRLADETPTLLNRVGLVTYGSQLQWAYGRGFTDMLSYFSHEDVMADLTGRWCNIIRFTDPVGGPVLSWRLEVDGAEISGRGLDMFPSGPDGTSVATDAAGPGAIRMGRELWLPDPVLVPPLFPPRKHSDYPLDTHWDDVVARAAGLIS